MKGKNIFQRIKCYLECHLKPKTIIIIGVLVVVCVLAFSMMNKMGGSEAVEFSVLSDTEIPQDIVGQVIPEYRGLERALACMVEDKIYVMVSRGEKPTSGFDVAIDTMVVEEKDGVQCLTVNAVFKDPEPGVALTQILTYPVKIAETDLVELPEQIELRVTY